MALCCLTCIPLQGLTRRERDQQKFQAAKERKAAMPATMISKMNFDELKNRKNELMAGGYKDTALKYYEKMLPLCTDIKELGQLMLEYSDLLFELGFLDRAGLLYEQFTRLYPGNAKAEYANYKAILCAFYKMLDTDRDQTKTKETIALAQLFLNRNTIFKEYAGEVKNILKTCQETLLQSELNIVSFYQKRGSYNAAQVRLASIEKEFNNIIPSLKPRLLTIEYQLALDQHNPELAKEKQTQLAQQFPEYVAQQTTQLVAAQPKQKKVDFVARF